MGKGTHRWNIARAGGVDQITVTSGDDLAHLDELDPKLWMALSIPTRGVELDARTLELLDTDRDGYVRHPEVLAAIAWLRDAYKDLGDVLAGGDTVRLERLQDGPVRAGARRLLVWIGKPDADEISLADVTRARERFGEAVLNGDGVIPPEAARGDERASIEAIAAAHGTILDRVGKPGVDRPRIEAFFGEARALLAWHERADAAVLPLGDATPAAADAVRAVRAKVDDFFTRCRLAALDPRAATALAALAASDAELAALVGKELSPSSADVAHLPLARVAPGAALPLDNALNPAWQARIATLAAAAITPLLGARATLDERDWDLVTGRLAAYEAWLAAKPVTPAGELGPERLRAALAHEAAVIALLDEDLAAKAEADAIEQIEKLCRYQRDLRALVDNYVNFSAFYARKGGVFQAGTLYLDGRACQLVVEVTDATKHASLAPMAAIYLAYCDCVRTGGEKLSIAAAFTAGDVDNLFVGRNGVFVDRKDRDWQATITKIIENPLSIRQAFWSPYKKLARALEERVAKRAAAADADATTKLADAATALPATPEPAGPAKAPKKGVDVGTVAALGVAVGGIAAVLTAILSGILGLGVWAPLGLLAIMLAISTPAMVLAFLKLRRRNLGPLLDANGWAVNAHARINIPFGTALTEVATLPAHARRQRNDPYADKPHPWRLYAAFAIVIALGSAWYYGVLDDILPEGARSTAVRGDHAPAAPPANP
jgi:hypothetical protein